MSNHDDDRLAHIHPTVRAFVSGASIHSIDRRQARPWRARLASNESPDPPFPEVQGALQDAIARAHRYPDIGCHSLRAAIAAHLDIDPDWVLVAGGSTALMRVAWEVFAGPDRAAVTASPTFAMARIAGLMSSAPLREVPLTDALSHDLTAMRRALNPGDAGLVYLCNPNNPTGTHTPAPSLRAFLHNLPEPTVALVDEAYHAYAHAPDYASMLPEALTLPRVLVLRTFSKVYALAGLRVGYAVGHPDLLTALAVRLGRDTLSTLTAVAAEVALSCADRTRARILTNARTRAAFARQLADRALHAPPSQTNFVYIDTQRDPQHVRDALVQRGVLVRPMTGTHIRVAFGTPDANAAFFEALDEALEVVPLAT